MKWIGGISDWLRAQMRSSPLSRHNLRRIKGIRREEVRSLGTANVPDQDALQKQLDGNPGSVFRGLESSTHLTRSRLLSLLQASLELWTRPSIFCRVRRHWADVLLMAVISLLVVEFLFPPTKAYRVIAAREIPAFYQIQRNDLEEIPSTDGVGETIAQYEGRYSLSLVHAKSALSAADLTTGLVFLRIEIKSSSVPDTAALPQAVLLVFSSRQPPVGGTVIPAMLSRMESNGIAQIATLQVSFAQRAEVAKWMGSADAYIALRTP